MRLGIHASVRHGLLSACAEAAELDCGSVQIFPRPPGAEFVLPTENEIQSVREYRSQHHISDIAVHSVYQPNIASSSEKVRQRSFISFVQELRFTDCLQAEFLIIHSGNFSPGASLSKGLSLSAQSIRNAIDEVKPKSRVLVENVAGGDRRMGSTFEELKELLDAVGSPGQTGVCFDTAHAFAAGYPVNTVSGMEDTLAEFDKIIGLQYLNYFHLNDSGAEQGSRRDIHQHIGQGHIGAEPIQYLTRMPQFADVSGVLETPRFPSGSNAENLRILRARA